MARQMLKAGDYRNAEKTLTEIIDSMPDNKLAINGLLSAQTAAKAKKEGSGYTVKRMDIFCSRRADFSPMLTGDQYDHLYFTSTRNEAQGDEISGITMVTGATFHVVEPAKNSASFTDELVTNDNGARYRTQTITFSVTGQYDKDKPSHPVFVFPSSISVKVCILASVLSAKFSATASMIAGFLGEPNSYSP